MSIASLALRRSTARLSSACHAIPLASFGKTVADEEHRAAPPRDGSAAGVVEPGLYQPRVAWPEHGIDVEAVRRRQVEQAVLDTRHRIPKRVLHQRFYASRCVVRHRQLKPREAGRTNDAGIDRG